MEQISQYMDVDKSRFELYFNCFAYLRIMQAMGSYGYRGYLEGKEQFLASIPFAVSNLEYLESHVDLNLELDELHSVFRQIIGTSQHLPARKKDKLTVSVKSFSYKKGFPQDISGNGGGFVFDCRALHNPGRYEQYKNSTGEDGDVIDFLDNQEEVQVFFANVLSLVNQSCMAYISRHFTNISVYFGCTGGQHRSVYMAKRLADELSQNADLDVVLQHVEQNN
jgi:RNase adaptor protein for sRNA GlmZ degradation